MIVEVLALLDPRRRSEEDGEPANDVDPERDRVGPATEERMSIARLGRSLSDSELETTTGACAWIYRTFRTTGVTGALIWLSLVLCTVGRMTM